MSALALTNMSLLIQRGHCPTRRPYLGIYTIITRTVEKHSNPHGNSQSGWA